MHALLVYLVYLKEDDAEQDVDGDLDLFAQQDEKTGQELAEEIDDDEQVGQTLARRPRLVDVRAMLVPFEPDAYAVLEIGGYEAEAGQVWQIAAALLHHLHTVTQRE